MEKRDVEVGETPLVDGDQRGTYTFGDVGGRWSTQKEDRIWIIGLAYLPDFLPAGRVHHA
jgi:hypothetical protein